MAPTPAGDLEVGEVGLPELVGRRGLVLERVGCLDDDGSRAGDEIVGLEQAVDGSLRDGIAPLIGEAHGQLAGRQRRLVQRQGDDLAADALGEAVPHAAGPGRTVAERLRPAGPVEIVPPVERGSRDGEFLQSAADRQVRPLDQADDLGLLGCGIPQAPSPPSRRMLF